MRQRQNGKNHVDQYLSNLLSKATIFTHTIKKKAMKMYQSYLSNFVFNLSIKYFSKECISNSKFQLKT